MEEAWAAVLAWYRDHPAPGVDLGALNPPANARQVRAAERFLGVTFSDELVWLYRRHNGLDHIRCGVTLAGCRFLSLAEMRSCWSKWKEVYDEMRADGSWYDEPGADCHKTWIPGWVPFTDQWGGGGWGHWVDHEPGPEGDRGQVLLVFPDDASVQASSLRLWLWDFVEELEAGKWVPARHGGIRRIDRPDGADA
jgi:cell wall assembly regulator SMI1